MNRLAAVIVTYNRKELLCECLDAVLAQKRITPDILVIDNHSTDGTKEAVSDYQTRCEMILYFDTGSNLGGAGGFQYGIRKGVELGYKYLWLMDDDCVPNNTALAVFLKASEYLNNQYGFLSSKVLWKDGSICRMNVQREKVTKNVKNFDKKLIPIVMSSFVSLFIKADIVLELGLPIKEFFIWTDDWEFTRRISRKYPCYLVTGSTVVHKSNMNITADVSSDTADRLDRFRYLYRNDVYLYRREGLRGFVYECIRLSLHCLRVLVKSKDCKWERLSKIISGTKEGIGFHPAIEYVSLDCSGDKEQE